uniref:SnoaL-like domain-containing protein n=1 Tax=Tetradesmus obliquus TaxID=3088 RepID=A0A383VKT0_TETOB|eukprot:jgi/Sobl393_1/15348/SZX66145.1
MFCYIKAAPVSVRRTSAVPAFSRQALYVRAEAGRAGSERRSLIVQRARQLYEDVWSQGRVLLLDSIMAEDHQQLDRVWQATAGGSRRRMKRGVLAYRAAYPDIKFTIPTIAPVEGDNQVFVHWEAAGTNLGNIREQPPTGKRVEFAGISLLSFNDAGEIAKTMVFRQAPADEMAYFLSTRNQETASNE